MDTFQPPKAQSAEVILPACTSFKALCIVLSIGISADRSLFEVLTYPPKEMKNYLRIDENTMPLSS